MYVPGGWTGTMPNGDRVDSSATFLSIRSFYQDDPAWSKVESYLKGGAAPVFTYRRFWAQADIALAMGSYASSSNSPSPRLARTYTSRAGRAPARPARLLRIPHHRRNHPHESDTCSRGWP